MAKLAASWSEEDERQELEAEARVAKLLAASRSNAEHNEKVAAAAARRRDLWAKIVDENQPKKARKPAPKKSGTGRAPAATLGSMTKAAKVPVGKTGKPLHGAALAAYQGRGASLVGYAMTHKERKGGEVVRVVARAPKGSPKPRATVRYGESRGGRPGTTNPYHYQPQQRRRRRHNPMGPVMNALITLGLTAGSFLVAGVAATIIGGDVERQVMTRRIAGALILGTGLYVAKKNAPVGAGLAAGGGIAIYGNELLLKAVSTVAELKGKVATTTVKGVVGGGNVYRMGDRMQQLERQNMNGVVVNGRLLAGDRGRPPVTAGYQTMGSSFAPPGLSPSPFP